MNLKNGVRGVNKVRRALFFFFGVLGWSFPMFVVLALFLNRPETGFTHAYLIGSATVWLLAGALMLWSMNERAYLKDLNNRETDREQE